LYFICMQLHTIGFGPHQVIIGVLAVADLQRVTQLMGRGAGGRRSGGSSCRPKVGVIADAHVMLVPEETVPFRQGCIEPEVKALCCYFIVADGPDFETDTGLGKPDRVYFFKNRNPFLSRPCTASKMDAQGNPVHRFENLVIPVCPDLPHAGSGYRDRDEKKKQEGRDTSSIHGQDVMHSIH